MKQTNYTYISELAPWQLFLSVLAIIFITETFIMFGLEGTLPLTIAPWIENLVDAFLLNLVAGPIIWWIFIHPLKKVATQEQAKYSAIVEAVVDGIITLDEKGNMELLNPAAEKIFGFTSNKLIGKNFRNLFEDGSSFEQFWQSVISGKRIFGYETQGKRMSGEVFPMEISINEISSSARVIYTAIVRDIEHRKRAEDKIRQLSRAVEQSPCSVVITDTRGNIEYVNPKFTRLTGYTPQEVIGNNPRILKSGERPAEDYKKLWEEISSGNEWRGEFHNKKKNGELYWEFASISPIYNDKGRITHYLAVKEDVTTRKQQEEEIKRLNQSLEKHAAELELSNNELEAFNYSVSHDLRNPLQCIDSWSYLLSQSLDANDCEKGKTYIQEIRTSTHRMGQLIVDLLNLSKVSRGEMKSEEISLTQAAKGIIEELLASHPGYQAEFQVSEDMTAMGDYQFIRIALTNLIGNAIKYTSKVSQPKIEFGRISESNGYNTFFIKDNGAGFDMKESGKLFKVFQRLHTQSEFEGTGIGLTIVQRIISRHGGKVWAQSEIHNGATFFFTLPVTTGLPQLTGKMPHH